MKHNVNLNERTGAYSNCLSENLQSIYEAYENSSIDVTAFKSMIFDITKNACDTEAKKKFIANVTSKRTKDDVVMYVSNVTLRAQHLSANVNDKWSNEK